MNIILNSKKQLRSIWWVAVFFLVLAAFTFPLILFSRQYGWEITIAQQAVVVVAATWVCQLLRRKPLSELTGQINRAAARNVFTGLALGALLMLAPAGLLTICGYVKWQQGTGTGMAMLNLTGVFLSVAVAEEFLFRGFVFQRLRESIGIWAAQLILAGYFLLTHINNPGMVGNVKIIAGINIFIASIVFGLAFLRTNNLMMPIGMHFMANWTQGALLGFGVSGNVQPSVLKPVFANAPQWLTGGSFGLEASIPGLVSVIVLAIVLYRRKPVFTT